MRAVLSSAVLAVVVACTFPDVDYADGGAGSAGGSGSTSSSVSSSNSSSSTSSAGMCVVSAMCATDAMACAEKADGAHTGCVQQCNTNQQCINGCDKDLHGALVTCSAACDSCGGCKPNNCSKLVGL